MMETGKKQDDRDSRCAQKETLSEKGEDKAIGPSTAPVCPVSFKVMDKIYVLDRCFKQPWKIALIDKIYRKFGKTMLDLKFCEKDKSYNPKHKETRRETINAKHIAAFDPPKLKWIQIGQRVIARKKNEIHFFVGIVAEQPSGANKQRSLIFFDDGSAAYCSIENIRLVTTNGLIPNKPWLQVHPSNQKFIKRYIKQFPNNSKATLRLWALTTVEWNGNWWTARVLNIDCSLMELELMSNGLRQIVWRGSQRLLQNYKQLQRKQLEVRISSSVDTLEEYEGKIVYHKIPADYIKKRPPLVSHDCSKNCWVAFPDVTNKLQKVSLLEVPLYHGWSRKIQEPTDKKIKAVYYEAPCGKIYFNLKQVQDFITRTNYHIGIDAFTFSLSIECLGEFQVAQSYFQPGHYYCEDISKGLEWTPISKVNTVNTTQPIETEYDNKLRPSSDVSINPDSGFMVCCDCTDNCEDKLKCACFRLTLENKPKFLDGTLPGSSSSYLHRRLFKAVISGIYECNKGCKCRPVTCINRVAQHGLKCKLQVFCTSNKGYAVRTMQDIPRGSFICTYAGELLSSEQAVINGEKFGDEYLAQLDFLEFCEQQKEGYEETAVEPKSMRSEFPEIPKHIIRTFAEEMKGISKVRYHFGLTQDKIYVVDPTRIGNVARYINYAQVCFSAVDLISIFYFLPQKPYDQHSCNPNLVCQHVFVDSHDIRFPWLSLFAGCDIKCGTELTWDYNYKEGVSYGRSLSCNCGAVNCKRRLL